MKLTAKITTKYSNLVFYCRFCLRKINFLILVKKNFWNKILKQLLI